MSGEVIVECAHGLPCLLQDIIPYHLERKSKEKGATSEILYGFIHLVLN